MKRRSFLRTDRHQVAGSPKPPIRMGQYWEPVLTADKLKVALAQRAEARLTAMELENRLKELQARLRSSRLLPSSRETERKNNMIHINLLSETDRGRWVIYSAISLHSERGRIKDWTDQLVYVVYQCNDQWDRFEEYTAAATDPEDLDFV